MRENEWFKNNRTLSAVIYDLCEKEIIKRGKSLNTKEETNIINKYNQIAERLEDYGLGSITVGDIKDFMKRELGLEKDFKISDVDIIKYIMDEQNREKLTKLGVRRLEYDTEKNDYKQKQMDKEYGEWDQMF